MSISGCDRRDIGGACGSAGGSMTAVCWPCIWASGNIICCTWRTCWIGRSCRRARGCWKTRSSGAAGPRKSGTRRCIVREARGSPVGRICWSRRGHAGSSSTCTAVAGQEAFDVGGVALSVDLVVFRESCFPKHRTTKLPRILALEVRENLLGLGSI